MYIFKTKPYKHQIECFNYAETHDRFLLADQQGLGKALSLDTIIYTADGYKTMEDIDVGDYVFGIDGKQTLVTATYYHENVEMYEITFSDGNKVKCCKDHLWEIETREGKKIVDTKWFTEKDKFGKIRLENLFSGGSYKYWIPNCKPVEFIEKSVPISPYLLGFLLGDGCISSGYVGFTTADSECVSRLSNEIPDGCKIKKTADISYIITRTKNNKKTNYVLDSLRRLNLIGTNSHTKFVPELYKYNSIEIRKQILAGLLDTDGYASNDNLVQFTSVSERLANDVLFLAESLGCICNKQQKEVSYKGSTKSIAYTITIRCDNPSKLFFLTRKKERLHKRKFCPRRNIVSINRIQNSNAKCITVDSKDSLYLVDHFIPTHNTKEVIDIACNFKQKNKYEHCLIICGVNGLKWNWEQEILIHSSETGHILGAKKKKNTVIIGSNENKLEDLENIDTLPYFIITNIESLRYKVKTGKTKTKRYRGRTTVVEEYKYPITDKLVELCKSGKINMIAADECHKMKNPESEQGQQFLRLDAEIKIAMTGTPILNTPLDLFIILKWLGYEDHSFWQFKSHYCRLGGYGGYEVIGYKNTQQLTDTLNKMMIRRLKKDVLDLPEKNYIIEYVEMSSRQKKIYDSIRNELLEEIDLISSSSNPLSMLIRARQATGYTGILSSSVQESAKLDRLEEIVQTIIEDGEKAVIFSNWTSITDEIVNRLNKYSPLVITGETKDSDRQLLVNEFQTNDKNKIIIGTVGAMGTGLTLTAAQNVIFVDEPWNMGIREQAEDRCHRIGQNNTVNIYILLTKNTIDERIHNLVQSKGDISDAIVDKKELVQYLLS